MKSKLIIVFVILNFLGACTSEKKRAEIIVSGMLPDLKNESITLVPVQDYFPGLTLDDSYPTVETDSLGEYKFKLIESNSNFYQIVHNNYHQLKADIYLEPGDSLFINQSSWRDSPKFQINGKGCEKFKYLEKDYSIFPKDKAFYNKIRSNFFASEIDFKRFIDGLYFERVNGLASVNVVPELLRVYHQNTLEAERAQILLEYLESRNYYMNEKDSYFYPDTSYIIFLDSIRFDNKFSQTTASRLLAKNYLNYFARIAYQTNTDEEWWKENLGYKLKLVLDNPKSLWTDLLALSTVNEYSDGLMTDDFFVDLEKFTIDMSDRFFNSKNQRLYEINSETYKNLAPGNPAPDFELPDSVGKLRRLSDFKGSVVYIDFWGTWCYPCIQEIPDALKLQEKYKNQPVIFLYVAMEYDSINIADWKEFIVGKNTRFSELLNNKPFPGIHLVAERQFLNESISAYKINFAPTHVLIDQKGNIVNARAKRSNLIHEEIDELLRQ
ncbi:TlpA family protein disulfide reductase [Aestuariivivens sediminis]|uniref:TlpA family protein disulfide reductase n=1 Tax=Aestuariivivens sediminis TaxID=2913557 RepID=UPI001F598131|nr:TlpA disulfide reductase family protein [Aestuariivivens sediminis]